MSAGLRVLPHPRRGVREHVVEGHAHDLATSGWLCPVQSDGIGAWRLSAGAKEPIQRVWADLVLADRACVQAAAQRSLAILDAWSKTRRV